jgi:hypothetical protein
VHAPSEDKDGDIKGSFYEGLEQVFVRVWREDIFKPIIGNESLYEVSSDNGVRVVNSATSNNLSRVHTTFPHCDIHKHTWTFPDGVTHKIDHVLTDKRRSSRILHVRSFRGADCDTNYHLVVAKLRGRISVSKRVRQNFDTERSDTKTLNDIEIKEKSALENVGEILGINSALESTRDNIKISAKENLGCHRLKHSKSWFDDDCSKLIGNGRKLNYNGCKIQAKSMEIICRIYVKPVEHLGKRKGNI